jgi:hypothetical protein
LKAEGALLYSIIWYTIRQDWPAPHRDEGGEQGSAHGGR